MKNKNKVYVVMGQVDYENTDCLGVYSSKEDASVAINEYMKAAQKDWDSKTYDMCKYDRYFVEERDMNVPSRCSWGRINALEVISA